MLVLTEKSTQRDSSELSFIGGKMRIAAQEIAPQVALRILQARILEWVAFPFSRGSSQPRDRTQVSRTAGGFFTSWATKEQLLYCCPANKFIDTILLVPYICVSIWYLSFSCTPMFIAALFTTARTWKQPRCPSTDEWIKKLWYIYTVEYYSICHFCAEGHRESMEPILPSD